MPIRAITFDLDDTLWEIWPVIERAERATHQWFAQNYPRVAERFPVARMRELRQSMDVHYSERAHDLTFMRQATFREAARQCGYDAAAGDGALGVFLDARHDVNLFEDVRPALENLRGRFLLGALTNGNADIARIGLDGFFSFRVSAAEVGAPKPAAAMFEAACAAAGARAHEVVHVGDDPQHDVAGATAAGMRAVWVNRRGADWIDSAPAPAQVRSLLELCTLLERGGPW